MHIRLMSFIRNLVIIGVLLVLVLSLPGTPGTQAAPNAALLATETFRNDTATDWSLYGTACLTAGSACASGTPISEGNGNGWLRLTSDTINQSGSAILNTAFSSAAGLQATFTYATYGGTGSDGITFYLIDGATVSPTLGPPGGALGYSWATDYAAPGVTNGYVGIGLDELGHFSNSGFGACNPSCSAVMSSSIAVRGSGSLSTGFNFLTRADYPVSTGSRVGAKRVRITITPGTPILTVQVDSGSGFVPVINNLDLSTAIDQSALPATFKLGLAAGTGNATNYHEIRDLTVTEIDPSSTSLGTSGSPSNYGDAVTFTATVTGTSGLPTGTVIFFDGATTLGTGTLDGSGQATLSTSSLVVGARSITVWYAGDSTYAPSVSSVLAQEVNCVSSYTVTNGNDSGSGSLRYAINSVCADGLITFDNSYTITLASELAIGKSLTIDGETHQIVVSGNNATRVFNVTAGNVTFAHLTIANGRAQTTDCGSLGAYQCGSGIMVQNSSVAVTVTNSTFFSNAAIYGGGIGNFGALAVTHSTLMSNTASAGGGIGNFGTLTVQTSTFSGNLAPVGGGGGFYNANTGSVTMTNSTLSGNSGSWGGGIGNFGALMVQTSTLSANSATGTSGGGLYNSGGTLTVIGSTFYSNSATTSGGGFYNYSSTVTVTGSTFYSNSATSGGGLYNWGGMLTVQNSTLSSNSVTSSGGGVYVANGTVTLENSTLSSNKSTGSGSAVTAGGSNSPCAVGNVILKNATLAGGAGGNSAARVTAATCGGLPTLTLVNTLVSRGTETNAFNVAPGSIITDGGHNLTTDGSGPNTPAGITVYADLGLGSLGNYGGDTFTIPLPPGSPAIDAGDAAQCPATDQRGQVRNDLHCDIGAYELKYADSPTVIRAVSSATLTTFGPALMGLQRDAGFTDPGIITATKGTWNTRGAESINAAWRITPTVTSGFSLTLQLCYTDAELGSLTEGDLRFWSSDGTAWTASAAVPTFTLVNGYHCATLSGLDHLSNWTLATSEPTAVTVQDLTAQSSAPTLWWVAGLIGLAVFGGVTLVIKRKRTTSA